MRREITNSRLWIIENDLLNLRESMPGLFFLQQTRIETFFQRNQMSLKILHQRMHELQKKYIVHNDQNQPQYAPQEEGKPKDWLYLERVVGKNGELITGDAVREEYHALVNEFLGRTVKVEL